MYSYLQLYITNIANLTFGAVSSPTSESESESNSFANGPGEAGGMLSSLVNILILPLGGGGRGGGWRLRVTSSSVLSWVETSEDDKVESSEDEKVEGAAASLLF